MKRFSFFTMALAASVMMLSLGACQEEEMPANITLPEGDVTFAWNDTESETVTVEANYEWTFEEDDSHDIIEVSRTEGTNDLVITPHINYASKEYSATVKIVAGSGNTVAEKSITVTTGANAATFLEIYGEKAMNFSTVDPSEAPEPKSVEIYTNNMLTVSACQGGDEDEVTAIASNGITKVEIPGVAWITYDLTDGESDAEGFNKVLTVTVEPNQSGSQTLNLTLDIVAGSDDIDNDVLKDHVAVVSLPSEPTILVNPADGLEFSYNQTEPQTFTVSANVAVNLDPAKPVWGSAESWTHEYLPVLTETTESGSGIIRTFDVTVPVWFETSDRTIQLDISQTDNEGESEPLRAGLTVRQTGAPAATVNVAESEVVINSDRPEATVSIETSIPELTAVTCTDDSGETADWFTAEYNSTINAIVINAEPAGDAERNGTIRVTVGGGSNIATASIDIKQLSIQPSIALSPASVILNQNGDPVVVRVTTNQESWSIDSSVSSDFSIAVDKEANTITVSGEALSAGSRTAKYQVTAGTATAELTVTQAVTLKVGDPYVVDGKTVGIVYEVDADGIHGKAFSLSVYNMSDKYFFKEASWLPENGYAQAGIDEAAIPTSMSDGKLNCETMKNELNWETKFELLKWVEDLGDEQGVEWYIPAINELKDLVAYMSNVPFTTVELTKDLIDGITGEVVGTTTYELDAIDIERSSEVEASWAKIRELYSTYTTSEYGYSEPQYVVLKPYSLNENYEIEDTGDHRHLVENAFDEPSDNAAYRWVSSTLNTDAYDAQMYYVSMVDSSTGYEYPSVQSNLSILFDPTTYTWLEDPHDYETFACSVHPICQF